MALVGVTRPGRAAPMRRVVMLSRRAPRLHLALSSVLIVSNLTLWVWLLAEVTTLFPRHGIVVGMPTLLAVVYVVPVMLIAVHRWALHPYLMLARRAGLEHALRTTLRMPDGLSTGDLDRFVAAHVFAWVDAGIGLRRAALLVAAGVDVHRANDPDVAALDDDEITVYAQLRWMTRLETDRC